jgi:hypothetical protein
MKKFYRSIFILTFCLLIINTNKSKAQAWFSDITSPIIAEIDFGLDIDTPKEDGDSTKTSLIPIKQKSILKWAVFKRKNKNLELKNSNKNSQDSLSNIAATRIKREE